MRVEDFDYELPRALIAQTPSEKRDACRLMVLDRKQHTIEHRYFYDILAYLHPGDCLVLNDSRVIPARLYGVKSGTGAHIELLLVKRLEGDRWESMVRPGKRLKAGDEIAITGSDSLRARVLGYADPESGTRILEFSYEGNFMEALDAVGAMPLPPYIERPADAADKERYQTVYSRRDGSVAAPTAGLHFTEALLADAEAKGVELAYVTLHVGIGTFRPVTVSEVEEHHMHFEEYQIEAAQAERINRAIREGRRVISVGTTGTRTLESAAYYDEQAQTKAGKRGCWQLRAGAGSTDIFIYPGYRFHIVDALITNFHLPKSTLLMLVSAFYDRASVLAAYREAIAKAYRFFSYGDAMLIQ